MHKPLTIILDMDGVIVNPVPSFNRRLRKMYPEITPLPYEALTEYYFENLYPKNQREKLRRVWEADDLFASFNLIPGAIGAIRDLSILADVAICSAPTETSRTCLQNKWDYLIKHLGKEWSKRIILTLDKTRVHGDILIDDKPEVTGARKPSWEHVIYDHPWNRHIQGKRRLTWQNYKQVLGL